MAKTAGADGEHAPARDLWFALAWLVVAGLLRFSLLDRWSLWGDEAFTHINITEFDRGETSPSIRAYPLFFLLEWSAFHLLHFTSVEAALRVVPALAGTLVPAIFFLSTCGLLRRSERHLYAAMATFSPWLLFHAQFARFYALLLLVSAAATFQFLRAIRTDSTRRMVVASVLLTLAVLTHPTAVLLLAGLLASVLVQRIFGRPVRLRVVAPVLVLPLLLLIALILKFEAFQETIGFKLNLQDLGADTIIDLVQGIAYNLGLNLSILAVLGMWALFRRETLLFAEVTVGVSLSLFVLVVLAAMGISVEQRYLIPVVPLILIPAAVMLGHLIEPLKGRVIWPQFAVPAFALVPFLPSLVSHYLDGNRHDLRGAARFVRERIEADDGVVAENNYLMGLYMPELPEARLAEAPPQYALTLSHYKRMESSCRRLWVVVPTHFIDLGGDRKAFYEWALRQGRQMAEMYVPRLDYHQNRLQVFLVEMEGARPFKPTEGRQDLVESPAAVGR